MRSVSELQNISNDMLRVFKLFPWRCEMLLKDIFGGVLVFFTAYKVASTSAWSVGKIPCSIETLQS